LKIGFCFVGFKNRSLTVYRYGSVAIFSPPRKNAILKLRRAERGSEVGSMEIGVGGRGPLRVVWFFKK
jgi:hypothetical protein